MNTDTGFYRELEVGETIQKGDQYRDAEWGNTLNVGGSCGEKGEYRRPVPAPEQPQYRELEPHEVVQIGDQRLHPDIDVWVAQHPMGVGFTAGPNYKWRRPATPTLAVDPTARIIPAPDMVNEPPHYRNHSSGIECIQITEGFNFCLGNAIKYIWRAGLKGEEIEDLKKARWYLDREIERLKKP